MFKPSLLSYAWPRTSASPMPARSVVAWLGNVIACVMRLRNRRHECRLSQPCVAYSRIPGQTNCREACMAWVVLFLAGLCEVAWAVGLKYTDGFSQLWPTISILAAMALSVVLLELALRWLPLGRRPAYPSRAIRFPRHLVRYPTRNETARRAESCGALHP